MDIKDYEGLLEEFVTEMGGWLYFCQKRADGDFQIDSDIHSKKMYLEGIQRKVNGLFVIHIALFRLVSITETISLFLLGWVFWKVHKKAATLGRRGRSICAKETKLLIGVWFFSLFVIG